MRSQAVERTTVLPGEIMPYERVTLYSRANGFVERVLVDRGSNVRQGQLLVSVVAPELAAETAEAESRERIRRSGACRSPGATRRRTGNLRTTQERLQTLLAPSLETNSCTGRSLGRSCASSRSIRRGRYPGSQGLRRGVEAIAGLLKCNCAIAGVITERLVHPGALVGPGNGSAGALLELEQYLKLRLVVAVPESEVASVRLGRRVTFRVPAYKGRTFIRHPLPASTDRWIRRRERCRWNSMSELAKRAVTGHVSRSGLAYSQCGPVFAGTSDRRGDDHGTDLWHTRSRRPRGMGQCSPWRICGRYG